MSRFILLAWALLAAAWASASSYEAPLPAELHTGAELCAYVACGEVMPGAEAFSPRKGNPPYAEAYRTVDGHRQLAGYVFLSTDIAPVAAYSGKPLVTLIGMDRAGHITGAKVLKHSEPILLVGIPEGALTKFVRQYVGKFAGDRLQVGQSSDPTATPIDAISGATVTVIAENQTILRSAYEVAREVGIVKSVARPPARLTPFHGKASWKSLVDDGLVQRLTVYPADLGLPDTGEPYIDLYFGYLDAPDVGRNVLGDAGYERLMADLGADRHAVFLAANGTASFKGSAFVRGGIFDRVHLRQDFDTITFRDTDYRNLYAIEATGAPALRESGIFLVHGSGFSAAYPWKLVFLANRVGKASGAKTFVNFEREYWLTDRALEGGRPTIVRPDAAWVGVWKAKAVPLALFAALLAATALLYAFRDALVRRATRKDKRWVEVPRYLVWAGAIGFVGFYLKAQPSVTQVLTWFHSVLFHWEWELFLSDPFIFVFWWFIIAAVFLVGRGLFCGWLCPYGALSEALYRIARVIGLKRLQFELSKRWHDRFKWVKYGAFVVLLAVSFHDMGTAERLAEVEPFKTTFLVGVLNRSWPYVVFWGTLAVWAMLAERPFCKYLCPLGAGLAIPSTLRNFGLQRKSECDSCHACQKECGSQAIDEAGRIDPRECLACLDCQVLYYDDHACPPLAQERKRRVRAGEPLTPITAAGYYAPVGRVIPIAPVAVAARAPSAALDVPRVAEPHHPRLTWLLEEAKFHLLPWKAGYAGRHGLWKAAGMGLAAVVTIAWLLAGTGHLGPAAVIAWWIGWSLYEVTSRILSLPWIKEGRWWRRHFRPATKADVLAYVATKNLAIGAVLFAMLHSAGVLHFLAQWQVLQWLH